MIEWMELRLPPINLWNAPKQERKMLTFLPKLPEDMEDNAKCECDLCDRTMEAWECEPIEEFHKKMKVGDVVPAGQCPHCDGLVYVVEDDDE